MPSDVWESEAGPGADPFLVASIRRVRFRHHDALSPATLEIESKHGRYLHISPADGGVALHRGPSSGPADAVRVWEDLTESLPGAFDERPRLIAAHSGQAVRLELSTGHTLVCRPAAGDDLVLEQE